MVQLCLNASDLVEASSTRVSTLVVVGTSAGYDDHFDWVCSKILIPLLSPVLQGQEGDIEQPELKKQRKIPHSEDLLRSILAGLQPSWDAGTSTECWMQREEMIPLRVVLCVLPPSVSRHNAPGQPEAIFQLLKKSIRSSECTTIVPLCESKAYLYSVMCAIARVDNALVYSRKTGQTQTDIEIEDVVVSGEALLSGSNLLVVSPYNVEKREQQKFSALTSGIQLTRRLVDAPCNELNTDAFVRQALEAIKGLDHVKAQVIKGSELKEKGFGGLYSVGMAAHYPPAMVILTYEPPGTEDKKSIVMVGKGIVFDTGGLCLKTKTGMPGMKRDMGGAAAILSAFFASVRSDAVRNCPLHAVLCLAENAISPAALRPDDVIKLYSGKTVEINNTDAEGRLVLADGVASAAKNMNPKIIIDMATLTGAQGIATGKHFAALYCSHEGLESLAVEAGQESGDLCHPLPYAPEFFYKEFKSSMADMKNSVADRSNAQTSCAGEFIRSHLGDFLEKGGSWLHIDMAYCCFDKKDERATGWGVALLHRIVEKVGGEE